MNRKLSIPILCRAGIVMVSPANTYPGLTKEGKGEANEPGVYYPDGCTRNYTRVVPADDLQGRAGALWASQLGLTKAYVLDDTQLYGKGIADVFAAEAPTFGVEILGRDGIDGKATDYKATIDVRPANGEEVTRISGWVFEDLNWDGRRQSDEPGIPGVMVSDGLNVVVTDANGHGRVPIFPVDL